MWAGLCGLGMWAGNVGWECGLGMWAGLCGLGMWARTVWHGPARVRRGARATWRSRRSAGGLALKHGAITVSCANTPVPPDSVQASCGPPAPRLALKDGGIGEADAGPAPALKSAIWPCGHVLGDRFREPPGCPSERTRGLARAGSVRRRPRSPPLAPQSAASRALAVRMCEECGLKDGGIGEADAGPPPALKSSIWPCGHVLGDRFREPPACHPPRTRGLARAGCVRGGPLRPQGRRGPALGSADSIVL